MVPLGLNIEDCLRNVLRNHGWHAMFLDNLWITIVVVMTTNPEKHLQKAFSGSIIKITMVIHKSCQKT